MQLPEYCVHNETEIKGFFGPYRFLSNFYPVRVKINGVEYLSTEAAYQASKTIIAAERVRFELADPKEAREWGQKVTMRSDWEEIKKGVMFYLVAQKFMVSLPLREKLLATGTARLEETNHWGDQYWGVDIKKGGKNNLGQILEKVRNIVK